ncbi:MAG: S9 family peptidase [Myxococcales bacterium]
MSIDDLLGFRIVPEVQVSPDGRFIVLVVKESDGARDQDHSNLWLVGTAGGTPRQLTFDSSLTRAPRWSPDGSRLAFLSSRTGTSQLYVLRLDGGEARQITTRKEGAGIPSWSPDGKRLAFSGSTPTGKPAEGREAAWGHRPRVVDRMHYKSDGVGFLLHERMQLFVVSIDGGGEKQITEGTCDCLSPAWSPSGDLLAFGRSREGPREGHLTDIWTIAPDGGGARRLTQRVSSATAPSWDPDGGRIAFFGAEDPGESLRRVWVVSANGGDERPLTSSDVDVASYPVASPSSAAWSPDGSELAVLLASAGTTRVRRVPLGGGVRPDGERDGEGAGRQVTSFSAAPAARKIAFAWCDLALGGGIAVADWDGSHEIAIADMNDAWRARRRKPRVERRTFRGTHCPIEGFLLRPAEGSRHPLLVDVHGGPHSYVEFDYPYHPYWYELLEAGWAVLALNAPGSGSYGKEFAMRVRGRWGEEDLPDHLAAVDSLVREGIVDDQHLAIAGKSYGGYLAAWAVGKTRRFHAAVVSAPVADLISHFGTSDSGFYVDPYDMRGEIFSERERYLRLSPATWVGEATTPVLLLQGEDDLRCPAGQSEQLFQSLMRAGRVPVEMVLYPGGDHHVAEEGRPSHRVDYHRRIVEWIRKWA